MTAPRLTPHQTEVLARLRRQHGHMGRPIDVRQFGSEGALRRLEYKGLVALTTTRGPRGGYILHAAPV